MDHDHFDSLTRALAAEISRRRSLGLLPALGLGGALGIGADVEAKKKKKKRPRQDQAPPCTDQSCPLPPGCSQDVLEACTADLFEAVLAAAEPCEAACQDPDGAACRECLAPILEASLPDAQACVAETCGMPRSDASRIRRSARRE